MNKLLIVCAGLSLSLAACRSEESADGVADAGGSAADATPGSATTIYDVQNDATPVGSSVSLRSVVVTAIDTFGARTGGIYVQEQDGGAFSGVFLFVSASVSGALTVGDVVDVDGGIKDEFAFSEFEPGQSITQVTAADGGAISVTKISAGTAPAPELLNPWDLAADDAEAEKWEGVLIKFDGVRALGSAFGVSSSDSTLMEMSVTGPYRMGGSLAQLNGVRDDCYGSVTGIGDYFFNYKILPRSSADIVADAGGTSCLPPESTVALCEDNLDNDHDGFDDCADFSCQEAIAACTVDTTVVEAQNGTIAENTRIRLTDVVVTAVSADNKKFWVQDEGAASAFNGLYVFRGSMEEDLPVALLGRKVTVVGNLDEFEGQLTELTKVASLSVANPGTVSTLSGVSLADLSTMKDYEGVLVSVPAATIETGSIGACSKFCTFTVAAGVDLLVAADDIFRHSVTMGQCYGTFDGIMHYDNFNDRIVILPLSDGLSLGGGSCP